MKKFGGHTKIAMVQRTFSVEQHESTLALLWSARCYTVQNGGFSMKRTIVVVTVCQFGISLKLNIQVIKMWPL